MLQQLRIRHLAVVRNLSVRFEPGLNLLTGETGAGKSLIVGSLNLLLGGRAGKDRIRSGEESAAVEATFTLPEPDRAGWEAAGLPPDPGEGGRITAARVFRGDGKSTAFLNGQPVSLSRLRAALGDCLSIHGQHSQQDLLLPGAYLEVLDRFAGLLEQRESLQGIYDRIRRREQELARLRGDPETLRARREILEYQVSEIRNSRPRRNEDEELRREREVLRNSGRTLQACADLSAELESGEGLGASLDRLLRNLEELSPLDARFRIYQDRGREFSFLLPDLAREVSAFRESLDWRPGRLSEVEARLSHLHSLKTRFGGSLPAVLEFLAAAEGELGKLRDLESAAGTIERELAELRAAYRDLASEVSLLRKEAALRFGELLTGELYRLAFPRGTSIRVQVAPQPSPASPIQVDGQGVACGPLGWDAVELMVSTNPGEPARGLARIASGGELSRILLALRSLGSAGKPQGRTLIFDEVDAGIGAEAAAVVGERLRRLARTHQVICITHWPQIAAGADSHFRVRKRVSGGRTEVRVNRLTGEERRREIARMLGGRVAPSTSLRHATELLEAFSPAREAR